MSCVNYTIEKKQIGTGALLVINNYILGLLWGDQSFFLFDSFVFFDSLRKDKIRRISPTCRAILIKLDSLQSLENCIKPVYYSNYLHSTSYFLIDSLLPSTTFKTKMYRQQKKYNLIKNTLKS